MHTEEMISARDCFAHYEIEPSFLDSSKDAGLIEITIINEEVFVPTAQLNHLEKMIRLYYEMDINVEGIETITYLLQRMNDMQQRIIQLSNQLKLYEET